MIKTTKFFPVIFAILGLLSANGSFAQGQSGIDTESAFSKLAVPANRNSYYVSIDVGKAPYEVRINDIPLMNFSRPFSMTFIVNNAILQSGEQTITVIQQQPDPELQVKVTAKMFSNNELVKTDSIIAKDNKSQSTFRAVVPYQLKGWRESCDLSADTSIAGKALIWFKKMTDLLKQQKGSEFMKDIAPAEWLSYTAGYLSAAEAQMQHEAWTSFIRKGGFEVVDAGKGKIEVVGKGKLVHLVYADRNAGLAIVTPNGQTTFMDIFLHLPAEGQDLQPVMINYRQLTTDFRKYFNNKK